MPTICQPSNPHRCPCKQHGAALMVMLVILVMGSAAFLVSSLSRSVLQIERDQKTAEALAQAKEALIAYAMSSENAGGMSPRPGNLPRPDLDAPDYSNANYGVEEGSCSGGTIGRLPWKSLGISELVDSDGEPLWYAISGNFRKSSSIVNSDTAGTLDVYANDGTTLLTTSSDKAVAVVFAPGKIVGSQQRSTASDKTLASNYLEIGPNNRNNANTGGPFIAAVKTDTFNDKLIFIKESQFLPAIEKRVAGELKNLLKLYYTAWGTYPFAAPFTDPSTSAFDGATLTYNGLPPIGNINSIGTTITPVWNAIPTATFTGGSGTATCSRRPSSCTTTCTYWRCDISGISGTPTINITGVLDNIGFGLWRLHDPSANISGTPEVEVRISPSTTYMVATTVMDNVSVSGSLNNSGSATITFSGTVRAGNIPTRIQLYPNVIPSYSLPSWFAVNNWQQVMYYAISPGYAPGGGNACNPLPGTPSCLTVNGSGGGYNKRAVVVMTSGTLVGQAAHPNGTLANYLEGENVTPANYIYENKTNSSTFNDQVIIVAP